MITYEELIGEVESISKSDSPEDQEKARLLQEYWRATSEAPKHLVGVGVITYAKSVLRWLQGSPEVGDEIEHTKLRIYGTLLNIGEDGSCKIKSKLGSAILPVHYKHVRRAIHHDD